MMTSWRVGAPMEMPATRATIPKLREAHQDVPNLVSERFTQPMYIAAMFNMHPPIRIGDATLSRLQWGLKPFHYKGAVRNG